MKKLYYLLSLCGIIALSIACSEDQDCEEGIIEMPNSVALLDGTAYENNLLDCRTPRIQEFTFQGFAGGTFFGNQGTQIFVPAQSIIDQNGNPIDQIITLELIEMYQTGEIIACQLSTNGLSTTNTPEPLLSEGIYYLNLTIDDPDIIIGLTNPIQVFSPSDNQDLTLNQFNSLSCLGLDCKVLWEINTNTETIATTVEDPTGGTVDGYQTFIQILGWSSIARYNPDDGERTIIYNKAAPQFAGSNSDTFFLYDSESVGVSLFENFDTLNDVFSETFGQIPSGTQGTFILTTIQEELYRFGTQQTVIEMGTIGLTSQTSDVLESEFITRVNNLQ